MPEIAGDFFSLAELRACVIPSVAKRDGASHVPGSG
jgi:hypothetical protein